MRKILFVLLACLLLGVTTANAQTPPVKNPRGLAFTSPDHDRIDRYEIDVLAPDGSLVQTISVLKADTQVVNGEVLVVVNIQPVAFGDYTFRARAIAGTISSDNSVNSPVWQRAPMQTGQPDPRR